jgi:hypothetical protein
LCGVGPTDPATVVRGKVRSTLAALSTDMPADLRRAVVLAYALDPEHSYLRLEHRTDQLARELSCQHRTARRRIDEAVARLVATALDAAWAEVGAAPAWHMHAMHALLRLDTPTPELYETRDIAATRPVDDITVQFSLPRRPDDRGAEHDIAVDVLHGARIRDVSRHNDGQIFRLDLTLPRTLNPGERHLLCLHYRVPEGQPMREHYVFQPLTPCVRCTVRLRFPPDRAPRHVWRLDGVPPRAVDDRAPGPDRLHLDGVGEVASTFDGLRQGHAYGVAWSFEEAGR